MSLAYRVTVTEPGSRGTTLDRDVWGPFTAATSQEYVRRATGYPVDTSMLIERQQRRAGDARPELDPRDVWSAGGHALDAAGQPDLAERVREIAAVTS